jgi:hypothetical protein
MKKLFLLLALAGVMVACGDKKENKKDEAAKANTENVEKADPVDALVKKAVKALQAEDYAALESLEAEYNKLSKEDQAKFDAAMEKEMM